jgi:simple sugar transport system ATP-binding protein
LNHQAAIARLEKLLPSQSLSVPWRTLVGELSVGQKQRIEILKLLFRESQILFLDEPTAVLTPHEIVDFFEILRELKAQGRTLILITHKISEVLAICDTYTILRQGKLVGSGAVAEISGPEIVEKMIGRKLEAFPESASVPGDVLVDARGVHGLTSNRGSLKGVDLHVHAGEIVGIAGVDGSGQGQLIDCILGLQGFHGAIEIFGQPVRAGEIAEIRKRGVGLVPEDRHLQGLWLEESCFMNMAIGLEDRFVKFDVLQFDQLKHETANWAKIFDVRAASLDVAVGALSGGNQQKVIFAREVVGRKPKLLLCHQPTRGVDLGAIDLIHRKLIELKEKGLGVLMVSSELDELFKLCDRIYVLYEGRVAAEFKRVEFDRMRVGAAMTTAPANEMVSVSDFTSKENRNV